MCVKKIDSPSAQNELPSFPERLLLRFWKFINPKLKYCNLKCASFAYFLLFFSAFWCNNRQKWGKGTLFKLQQINFGLMNFRKLKRNCSGENGNSTRFEPKCKDLLPLKTFLFNVEAKFRCKNPFYFHNHCKSHFLFLEVYKLNLKKM